MILFVHFIMIFLLAIIIQKGILVKYRDLIDLLKEMQEIIDYLEENDEKNERMAG